MRKDEKVAHLRKKYGGLGKMKSIDEIESEWLEGIRVTDEQLKDTELD